MTERKPIQVPKDFALCEDGTMWKWVPAYSANTYSPFIPAHWSKLPNIPSDEEYEKQKEEREALWNKINDATEKQMRAALSSMNMGVVK